MKSNYKKIHFIGICGSAMGSVAAMLKEAGLNVQGSDDELYPPMSDYLRDAGIKIFESFSANNITADVDLVIVGNAISRGNVELEHVLDNNISYTSFPEVIKEFFLRGNTSIVVTGTHGKTSTTSLISWILKNAGRNVGFLVGGIPLNFGKGFCLNKPNGCFVIEGDEYDTAFFDKRSKFLHYKPDVLIINNIEFDHADIFKDIDDVKRSFSHLIKIVPSGGLIVANADNENVRDITQKVFSRLKTFSIREKDADYIAKNITYGADATGFDIVRDGETVASITTSLKGEFSVYNILAAYTALDGFSVTADEFQSGISSFKSVKRRLEEVGEASGIKVFDDFAHHPTAIQKTIAGMKLAYPDKRVIALFEPKSNTSRGNRFQKDFVSAFDGADVVIIGKVYNYENMIVAERLDPNQLVADFGKAEIDAAYISDTDELADHVAKLARSGDIILVMSSGSFYGIHQKILKRLRERDG